MSWPSGPSATSTTSASPGATSLTKPKNRSGGHEPTPALASPPSRDAGSFLPESVRCTHDAASRRSQAIFRRAAFAQRRARSRCVSSSRAMREELQNYFRSLSTRSRYNRFLGAMRELPKNVARAFRPRRRARAIQWWSRPIMVDGFEAIVGEARYAFHAEDVERRVRRLDRRPLAGPGHRQGAPEESRMPRRVASGAARMFGDTLRSNTTMIGLARKEADYAFTNSPGDWKLVRFENTSMSNRRIFPVPAGGCAATISCTAADATNSPAVLGPLSEPGSALHTGPFQF